MVWRAADVAAPRNRHHVMECWNASSRAGERSRLRRMRVHDRSHLLPCLEDVAVETPFARGAPAPEPASVEIHQRNILGLQRFVIHTARAHEKALLTAAHADIAGGAMCQAAARQLATGGDHLRAQVGLAAAGTESAHSAAFISGYSRCNPARLAGQLPRSVIRPVTSRAGVTSKARFRAALCSGTNLTLSIRPAALRPVMCVTSCGDRSSMGIAEPAWIDQSMVLT